MTVEGDLLLQPADGELASMRQFARFGFSRIGLRQFEAQRLGGGLDLGEAGRGKRLARSRASASFVRADSIAAPSVR